MAVPDFSQYTPQGTPGASTDTLAAQQLVQRANIQSSATTKLGEAQTQFVHEDAPALASGIGATGQYFSGARRLAQGNQERHYLDSQHDIISGAHNALDDLTRQQAYAALGLII